MVDFDSSKMFVDSENWYFFLSFISILISVYKYVPIKSLSVTWSIMQLNH